MTATPIMQRLLTLSSPDTSSGCWLWTGHIKPNGYGTLGVKVGDAWKTAHAHRVSYEAFIGPLPDGADLDHTCRNRRCVSPNHLDPVSRSENLRRSPLMNRQADKLTCPKGHPYSGTNSKGERACQSCLADASRRYRARRAQS